MTEPPSISLFELNSLVRCAIEQTLPDEYWLEAELSEARQASNGHFYVEFIEKDAQGRNIIARARGTIWARTYSLLAPLFERATGERLRAGLKVRVRVSVVFHELYGYSLNVVNIDPTYTLGDMAQRRREILAQLQKDGIAEDNRQLTLPRLLRRIAIISSATAAGYGDFCDQLQVNDYGLAFDLRLFPAVMQGANVEESVLAALEAIMLDADAWDCVVIIRGGGATSDLSDFDTYALAAAVAQMPIPVIVGIGHERDETVLDFVAHTRVKTPTAAAAFLISHGAAELAALDELQTRIIHSARLLLENSKQQFQRIATQLPRVFALMHERQQRRLDLLAARLASAPQRQLADGNHRLQLLQTRLHQAATLRLQTTRLRLDATAQRFAALDPVLQLRRGYSLTYDAEGRLLRSVAALSPNQNITTRLADGIITSTITTSAITTTSSAISTTNP